MGKLQIPQILVGLAVITLLFDFHSSVLLATADSIATLQGAIDLVSDLVGAYAVASADLDRDGDLDVIAAGRESGRVIWLENDGGAFSQFTLHEVGYVQGAYTLYSADLDRDGDSDIIVTGVGELKSAATEESMGATGTIVWFENNLRTGGGFTPHLVAGELPYSVAIHVVDVDRDGDPDIILAARDGNRVSWFENTGARPPAFVEHVISTNALGAVAVHAGDMDGDGDIDILSASEDDNKIALYRNDGARPPNFVEIVAYQPVLPPPGQDYAKAVYAADIDGDNDLDIAYVGKDNSEVGWLENSGGSPPAFVPHVLTNDANHAQAVLAIDLDGDGDGDMLAASSGDNQVVWFENLGGTPSTFAMHMITTAAAGVRAMHVVDLDGDGDLDLLTASHGDNRITWHPNWTIHRTAIFSKFTQSVVSVRPGARGVAAADLNGDGALDLLAIAENEILWHENNGAAPPGFTLHVIGTDISGGRWVAAGDLDGDGDPDVVAASKRNDLIFWYENLGGQPPTFASHIVTRDARGPRAVLVADIDGDGDLDLYSASDTDNVIAWYENQGGRPVIFQRQIVSQQAQYARSVYAADLDGDGDLDLMSASQVDNKVAWYENLGGSPPQFREQVVDSQASGAQHIHADDLDGDGDLDLVVASELDNSIRWYENLRGAPPSFRLHFVTQHAPAVHAVYSGDADQDGDVDLFAAIEGSNTIAWYENLGGNPPTFIERIIVNTTLVAHGIYAADIDGDGDLDVLSASREDGKVAWYENLGGQYAVTTAAHPENSAILHMVVNHRGRPGDPDLELVNFELQLLDDQEVPLTTEQANLLIQRINVHRVNCCEKVFDPTGSPLLATVSPLELADAGRQLIRLVPGDPNTRVPAGGSAAYVLVIQAAANSCQNGVRSFRAVNIVSSRVAQSSYDGTPLLAEYMRPGDRPLFATTPEHPVVMINEFMASNTSVAVDPNQPNYFPDWIELYNSSAVPIDLSGKFLTDDLTVPDKHRIADGVAIPPYGYLVFIADGPPASGPHHLNFKLEKNGESIGFYEASATGIKKLDEVVFGEQARDLSEGRYPNGSPTWQRLGVPTPGGPNHNFVSVSQVFLPTVNRAVACP